MQNAGRRKAFRTASYSRWSGFVTGVTLLVLIGGVISVLSEDDARGSMAVALAVIAAFAIPGGVLLYRITFGGILAGKDVVVRNPFRSYRLAWQEIDRFEIGPGRTYPSVAVVVLRDGTTITAPSIRGSGTDPAHPGPQATRLIAELNACLDKARRDR